MPATVCVGCSRRGAYLAVGATRGEAKQASHVGSGISSLSASASGPCPAAAPAAAHEPWQERSRSLGGEPSCHALESAQEQGCQLLELRDSRRPQRAPMSAQVARDCRPELPGPRGQRCEPLMAGGSPRLDTSASMASTVTRTPASPASSSAEVDAGTLATERSSAALGPPKRSPRQPPARPSPRGSLAAGPSSVRPRPRPLSSEAPDPYDGVVLTPLNDRPFQTIASIARQAHTALVERMVPQ
mmetsp:Transcript_30868/g.98506  ORF Transcript_30868/g.98506 Transcript_30868/m.98506 type:complete len:244 (+) Transcript_30868:675-1406(+)